MPHEHLAKESPAGATSIMTYTVKEKTENRLSICGGLLCRYATRTCCTRAPPLGVPLAWAHGHVADFDIKEKATRKRAHTCGGTVAVTTARWGLTQTPVTSGPQRRGFASQ